MLKIHSFLQRIKKPIAKFLPPGIGKYKMHAGVIAYTMATALFILSPDYIYDANNQPETHVKAQVVTPVVGEMVEETANEAVIRTRQKEQCNLRLMAAGETTYYSTAQILVNNKNTEANSIQIGAAAKVDNGSTDEENKLETKESSEKTADKTGETEKTEKKKKKKQVIDLSDSEIEILRRIVEAEATGENVKGKILVANVILNRVKDESFPNTVEGVVFQKDGNTYQFSPIRDKRYWSVKISKDTKTAVKRALEGEDYSKGALYFSARSKADKSSMSWFDRNLDFLFEYGGHEFFK